MSLLHPMRPSQLAAEVGGRIHRDLLRWLGGVAVVVNLAAVPNKGIIWANLTTADISAYFEASGAGSPGAAYEGWALCNGANGTPDLSGKFIRSSHSDAGPTGVTDDASHAHSATVSAPSATVSVEEGTELVFEEPASGTHTHDISLGASSNTDNMPAYHELIPLMRLEITA